MALLGAPYIYEISSLRVKAVHNDTYYEHHLMQIIVDNWFKAFE